MRHDSMDRRWRLGLSVLFFMSGSTGLIFEVLWTRLISSFVGGTAIAMTCVFMVYIVSLSLGARLAGRSKATGRRALALYGGVEAIIGVMGFALTMLMLHERAWLLEVAAATVGLEGVWSWALISGVIVGPPATLMGMTLPFALNALSGYASPREHVTTIYGVNILGGATGALLTGFVLVWKLGITGSAALAMGINLSIAAISLGVWWWLRQDEPTQDPQQEDHLKTDEAKDKVEDEPARGVALHSGARWVFLMVAFFGGLASLGYELLWGRIARFILGDRTMATSTLLAIYLGCMALGSFEVKRIANMFGWKTPQRLFATSALILLAAALAHPLLWWVTHALLTSDAGAALYLPGQTLTRMIAMMLLIFVPAGLLGVSFPLLMYGARELEALPGAVVGRLYFINSIGAAIGSLLGGYFLPRWIGTAYAFMIFTAVLVVAAALCLVWAHGRALSPRKVAPHLALLGGIVLVCALMPRTLHLYDAEHETLVHTAEDEYGIQVTTRDDEGLLKVKNNRVFMAYKLGREITNFAQEMIAYASCMMAPSCDEVLNIGTGYGITAGAFTLMGGVNRLVTVEMLPYVFEHQRMYEPFNHMYLDDARVERVLGDGRQYLLRSEQQWDIISVNVMDPYMPGSSELFMIDFWQLAKQRLKPGGVYSQLLFGSDVELLYQGLDEVFGTVLLFEAYANAYNVVAFVEDIEPGAPRLERMTPKARAAFTAITKKDPDIYWPEAAKKAHALGKKLALPAAAPRPRFHSDNWPLLEYQWSQGMGHSLSMFDSMQAYDYE